MTYATGHPIRAVAGRLVLDFVNTADWSDDGQVVSEKIETHDDAAVWLTALGLPDAMIPDDIDRLHRVRADVRAAIRGTGAPDLSFGQPGVPAFAAAIRSLPFLDLVAISAAALISDPREMSRLKTCPGIDCGWMFIDETKNGRRRWCTMETCGNRAKAARHYNRSKTALSETEG